MNKQKRNSMLAFVLCFVVLLMLLFSPNFFILKGKESWYEEIHYLNDLSFTESFTFYREFDKGIICGIMGFSLLLSVVVTMILHLDIFLGCTDKATNKGAAICSSIATSISLLYAPIAGGLISESYTLMDSEIGWTAFVLITIINVISVKSQNNAAVSNTDQPLNKVQSLDSSETVSNKLNDPQIADYEYIDFNCPHCNDKVSLTKEYLRESPVIVCPHCGKTIERT